MKTLWAPWRMEYILGFKDDQKPACIFCERYPRKDDKKNLILHRGPHSFVIMNRFPYNSGHLMVVPYRHTGNFQEISDEENLELIKTLQLCQKVLGKVMKPQGYNMGMNLERVGGAGVDDHLHWHIVPRWSGDINFMPVISDTKVISEALDKTYDRLKIVFDELTNA
ncbi:MAG: HIT domain-containing protein [Calditrichia bacterium]